VSAETSSGWGWESGEGVYVVQTESALTGLA
jgi:hypothetical protein